MDEVVPYLASMGYTQPIPLKTLCRGQYRKIWEFLVSRTRTAAQVKLIRDNLLVNKIRIVDDGVDDGAEAKRDALLSERERLLSRIAEVKRAREQLQRDSVHLSESIVLQQNGVDAERQKTQDNIDVQTLHSVFSSVLKEDRLLFTEYLGRVEHCREQIMDGSEVLRRLEVESQRQADDMEGPKEPLADLANSKVVTAMIYKMQLEHVATFARTQHITKTGVPRFDIEAQWRAIVAEEKLVKSNIENGNVVRAQLREVRSQVQELRRLYIRYRSQVDQDVSNTSAIARQLVTLQREAASFAHESIAPLVDTFRRFDGVPQYSRSQLNSFSYTGVGYDHLSIYSIPVFAKLLTNLGQILGYPSHLSVDGMLPFVVKSMLTALTGEDVGDEELALCQQRCSEALSVAKEAEADLENNVYPNDLQAAIQVCESMLEKSATVEKILGDWRHQPGQRALVGEAAEKYAQIISLLRTCMKHL